MTEKEFYILAGQKVKQLRESIAMSQKTISEKTGIAVSILSRFERDGKKLSAYRLQQILEAMGFSLSDIGTIPQKKKGLLYALKYRIDAANDFMDEIIDEMEKDALESQTRASEESRSRAAGEQHHECSDDKHCFQHV